MDRVRRLLVAAVLALSLASCQPPAAPVKVHTREEFKAAVMGKTQAEVLDAVGRPDETAEASIIMWYYRGRTYDPIIGKPDSSAQIVFDKKTGKVREVNY